MEIKKAETGDVERIVKELWHPLAKEMEQVSDFNELDDGDVVGESVKYRKARIMEGEYAMFYSSENGEMTGFVAVDIKEGNPVFSRGAYGVITDLFVKKDYRRSGTAGRLMEKAEEFLKVRGIQTVELEVNVENEKALKLYTKRGYEKERHKLVKKIGDSE